jgi:hypothetical protein
MPVLSGGRPTGVLPFLTVLLFLYRGMALAAQPVSAPGPKLAF